MYTRILRGGLVIANALAEQKIVGSITLSGKVLLGFPSGILSERTLDLYAVDCNRLARYYIGLNTITGVWVYSWYTSALLF